MLSFLLLPFSLIYCLISRLKFSFLCGQKDLGILVFSVGNLVVGGSGKSPLCKAIYSFFNEMSEYKNAVFIVLRGYRRKSKGCVVVSQKGEILVPCEASGDEAMDYAINGANVIVTGIFTIFQQPEGIVGACKHFESEVERAYKEGFSEGAY